MAGGRRMETNMKTAGKPEKLWFLNTLITVRVAAVEGTDGMTVLEHLVPFGDSPPMHIHHNEDEIFHMISGEVRLLVGGQEMKLRAGETLRAPKGVPHSFIVTSQEGARWLTVTCRGDFERMVRALGRPAERDGLPAPAGAPTPEQVAKLAEVCAAHGVDIVGPPLSSVRAAA
jgi:quercetin dioxygenase-like cupin family protein